jgi:hypothetical protein
MRRHQNFSRVISKPSPQFELGQRLPTDAFKQNGKHLKTGFSSGCGDTDTKKSEWLVLISSRLSVL